VIFDIQKKTFVNFLFVTCLGIFASDPIFWSNSSLGCSIVIVFSEATKGGKSKIKTAEEHRGAGRRGELFFCYFFKRIFWRHNNTKVYITS
jgi:hypothetical protein